PYIVGLHLVPHPFPTRRSSDLVIDMFFITDNFTTDCRMHRLFKERTFSCSYDFADFYKLSTAYAGFSLWTASACHWVINIFSIKDRKSTRLNSSHVKSSYAVFC